MRDANDRTYAAAETRHRHEGTDDVVCECQDAPCGEMVSLTHRQYESVRASPTRFDRDRREVPQIERLITENARFAIVETLPGTASRIALRSDPRATT